MRPGILGSIGGGMAPAPGQAEGRKLGRPVRPNKTALGRIFGDRLRRAMDYLRVEPRELAPRITSPVGRPVAPNLVSKWRGGQLPNDAMIDRVEDVLGVVRGWLRGQGPEGVREALEAGRPGIAGNAPLRPDRAGVPFQALPGDWTAVVALLESVRGTLVSAEHTLQTCEALLRAAQTENPPAVVSPAVAEATREGQRAVEAHRRSDEHPAQRPAKSARRKPA